MYMIPRLHIHFALRIYLRIDQQDFAFRREVRVLAGARLEHSVAAGPSRASPQQGPGALLTSLKLLVFPNYGNPQWAT
jgi:hypothetical protein